MSEADMRRTAIKLFAALDPKPIENIVGIGTPDVNIVPGWVELKWAREWPARMTTPLRLEHYTNAQRAWLMDRWNAGGGAWLLLQVKTSWLCFDAPAAQKVGALTREELFVAATHSSYVKPTAEQLCSWFVRRFV